MSLANAFIKEIIQIYSIMRRRQFSWGGDARTAIIDALTFLIKFT
jgi:hypothetical protein